MIPCTKVKNARSNKNDMLFEIQNYEPENECRNKREDAPGNCYRCYMHALLHMPINLVFI